MIKPGFRVICSILMLLFSPTLVQAQPAQRTVAVLDFGIPLQEKGKWAWAVGGLADYLQIELEQLGWTTLDRDLVHAVLAEQRLNESNLTAENRLKAGALLHARYLVSGKLIALNASRVRVEASAFTTESVETTASASGEGKMPDDLSTLIKSIAKQIADRLDATRSAVAPGEQARAAAPKPESLIMFYRGLNACASGQPEQAVPWFMNAASLDSQFTAPILWEIKAYEMAGFDRFAAICREEAADSLKQQGVDIGNLGADNRRTAMPVFAVLNPVMRLPFETNLQTGAAALASSIKEGLLASGRVRLFAFESIGQAMAEQDLKLSSFFARQYAPRYGRWLAADALLGCKAEAVNPDSITLEITLVNPLTSTPISSIRREGPLKNQHETARAAAKELAEQWQNKPDASPAASTPLSAQPMDDPLAGLRPAYKKLASALASVRKEPGKSDCHQALADAFNSTGRPRLSALEIERCIDTLDIHAANADKVFFGVHRWLFWSGMQPGAITKGLVSKQSIDRLIRSLLEAYPTSMAAGCLHYDLSVTAWQGGQWQESAEHAIHAREIIQPKSEHPELELELLAATYFLEGASWRKLGKRAEADSILRRGLEFMAKSKVRNECLPLGPWIGNFHGPDSVEGYGGEPPGIKNRLELELEILAGERARPTAAYLQNAAAELVASTNTPSRKKQEWLRCGEEIASMMDRAPSDDIEAMKGIASSASKALDEARNQNASDEELRVVAHKCAKAYLEKQIQAHKQLPTSIDKLTEHVNDALFFYGCVGMQDEVWWILEPFFSNEYPVELALNLLPTITWDWEIYTSELNRIAARMAASAATSRKDWLHLAQIYLGSDYFNESLECYRTAKAAGDSPPPGLVSALIEVALENNPGHPKEEIDRLCREYGLPRVTPSWVEWFAMGRKYQVSRRFDIDKAIVSYRSMLDFLEHPEQAGAGVYRLVQLPGKDRQGLRWGSGVSEQDLQWSGNYDSRWLTGAYYLAQCLIEADHREEAAAWLRQIALKAGGDKVEIWLSASWHGGSCFSIAIGVQAADMLKKLHEQSSYLAFGQEEGPYRLPPLRHKGRTWKNLTFPAYDPTVMTAWTATAAEYSRTRPMKLQHPLLEDFARQHGRRAVPVMLNLLNRCERAKHQSAMLWILEKTATLEDLPWLQALCHKNPYALKVVAMLSPKDATETIAELWHPFTELAFEQEILCGQIISLRLRPLYPLAIRHMAEADMCHPSVVVRLDALVQEDNSEAFAAAFRDALGAYIERRLQKKEFAQLDRLSQIALRRGAQSAIEGLLACPGLPPEKVLQEARPFVDLPSEDTQAMSILRANAGKWRWSAETKKYSPQSSS